MTVFKARAVRRGIHWWTTIFAAAQPKTTFRNLGHLVMTETELREFEVAAQSIPVERIEDDADS